MGEAQNLSLRYKAFANSTPYTDSQQNKFNLPYRIDRRCAVSAAIWASTNRRSVVTCTGQHQRKIAL